MAIALRNISSLKASPIGDTVHKFWRIARTGPLFRWRFSGFAPQRIIAQPIDLHLHDANLAHEFYHGRFALAGRLIEVGAYSPFEIKAPSPEWDAALHDHSWLRHMDAAQTALATAYARSLLSEWLEKHGRHLTGIAWQPAIVARRLISWLSHASMLLHNAGGDFERQFLRQLGLHTRFLRTSIHRMDANEQRLIAAAALAFASLALPLSKATRHAFEAQLETELAQQIFPDGGHISRNPAVLVTLLADLLALRHFYQSQHCLPPRGLRDSIERMLPALRFFLHKDQTLAHFNGVGPLLPQRISTLLKLDETGGQPFSHAPHSGYQRLETANTIIIADTGCSTERSIAHHANAGCLSFEMSSGRHRFIINTGIDPYSTPSHRHLGRLTAAHSTASLNDTSIGQFIQRAGHPEKVMAYGPTRVDVKRIDGRDRLGFIAQHNGYEPTFQLLHERGLILCHNGDVIEGFDRFYHQENQRLPDDGRHHVAVRFHLHPDIYISRDGRGLLLTAPNGDIWNFICSDVSPQIEDSLTLAHLEGPKRCQQIVLYFRPALHEKIRWRLTRLS
ncbi:heparinase II/III family protein [Bartonella sp. DGB2]|uniref:heparinase II/III family protein n=1 Tax=Bartonella sp. DGB2 TaxID=3388426 RepID=UPI00398FD146